MPQPVSNRFCVWQRRFQSSWRGATIEAQRLKSLLTNAKPAKAGWGYERLIPNRFPTGFACASGDFNRRGEAQRLKSLLTNAKLAKAGWGDERPLANQFCLRMDHEHEQPA